MTVEIEISKTDLNDIKRRMGIKTNTKAEVVLKSLISVVVSDENALMYSQYEN